MDSCGDTDFSCDKRPWLDMMKCIMESTPVPVDLATALMPILPLLPAGWTEGRIRAHADDCMEQILRKSPQLQDWHLINPDYAAGINCFSREDPPFYKITTKELVSAGRLNKGVVSEGVKRVIPFFKFVDVSVKSLPKSYWFAGEAFRGVKWNFPSLTRHSSSAVKAFFRGQHVIWCEGKSTSRDKRVMERDHFVGLHGAGTIFSILLKCGYRISQFSAHNDEDEVFVPWGAIFIVTAVVPLKSISKAHLVDADGNPDVHNWHHTGAPDVISMHQVDDFYGSGTTQALVAASHQDTLPRVFFRKGCKTKTFTASAAHQLELARILTKVDPDSGWRLPETDDTLLLAVHKIALAECRTIYFQKLWTGLTASATEGGFNIHVTHSGVVMKNNNNFPLRLRAQKRTSTGRRKDWNFNRDSMDHLGNPLPEGVIHDFILRANGLKRLSSDAAIVLQSGFYFLEAFSVDTHERIFAQILSGGKFWLSLRPLPRATGDSEQDSVEDEESD